MTHATPRSNASTLVGWAAVLAIIAALQFNGCTDETGWEVAPTATLPDDDDIANDDDDVTPAPADDDETAADDDDASGDDDVADDDDATPPSDDDDAVSDDDDATGASPVDADGDGRTDVIDCDDEDASVYPGAPEVCEDGIDQDCDGSIDEGCDNEPADDDDAVSDDDDTTPPPDPVVDADGDGYAATNAAGNVVDCNDLDATIHPGAPEVCEDGIDQDCSGSDAACPPPTDTDGDGSPDVVDCNDLDASIHPGATEVCGDGIDQDCSGADAVCPPTDADGDGYTPVVDCNDLDASVHPGATEVCNGIDEDCDGVIDDGFDADGDTWTVCELDCNDLDATVHPFAVDLCGDGIDSDCDGLASDETPFTGFIDFDGDGIGSTPFAGCAIPSTGVSVGGDCNDADPLVFPGASETTPGVDAIDNDCDGVIDEDWQAYVEVVYPSSGYYVLTAAFYTTGSVPNAYGWQEVDTEPSGTTTSVDFLTFEYGDMSSACGIIVNVNVGNPASSWLCQNWEVNPSVSIDAWIDGAWYDENDVVEWIANNSSGSCAAVIQTNSSAACTPVNDT